MVLIGQEHAAEGRARRTAGWTGAEDRPGEHANERGSLEKKLNVA